MDCKPSAFAGVASVCVPPQAESTNRAMISQHGASRARIAALALEYVRVLALALARASNFGTIGKSCYNLFARSVYDD